MGGDGGDSLKVRRAIENASENEQKNALKNLLEIHRGNVTKTAEAAGLALAHVKRLLKRYELADHARQLRERAQGRSRGRPSSIRVFPAAASASRPKFEK